MKRNRSFFLIWIKVLFVLPGTATSQTVEETIEFARAQTQAGNTELALKMWQRALFFAPEKYRAEGCAALARLHLAQGNLAESARFFDLLYHAAHSDSLRNEAVLGKAALLLLQRDHAGALLELLALGDSLPPPWHGRRLLFLGAANYGLADFGAAEKNLAALLAPQGPEKLKSLEHLFDQARHHHHKNPRTARNLSMALPGLGQFYFGDWKSGLNSFFLNAALATWFVVYAGTYSLPDAMMTVTPWFLRYYKGGFQHAEQIAVEKKQAALDKNFRKILKLLNG